MNLIFCKLKKAEKTWISFFFFANFEKLKKHGLVGDEGLSRVRWWVLCKVNPRAYLWLMSIFGIISAKQNPDFIVSTLTTLETCTELFQIA